MREAHVHGRLWIRPTGIARQVMEQARFDLRDPLRHRLRCRRGVVPDVDIFAPGSEVFQRGVDFCRRIEVCRDVRGVAFAVGDRPHDGSPPLRVNMHLSDVSVNAEGKPRRRICNVPGGRRGTGPFPATNA
jgi:hypothetical protein